MQNKELIELALKARESAYAPYSNFFVGAALLCDDGNVYCGCNIENTAFSPTCCAERVAIFKAISEGKRKFSAIAIVGAPKNGEMKMCYPCGVCRQVLSEFCDGSLKIVLYDGEKIAETTLGTLLPNAFDF
jgi:cytidine deaminase